MDIKIRMSVLTTERVSLRANYNKILKSSLKSMIMITTWKDRRKKRWSLGWTTTTISWMSMVYRRILPKNFTDLLLRIRIRCVVIQMKGSPRAPVFSRISWYDVFARTTSSDTTLTKRTWIWTSPKNRYSSRWQNNVFRLSRTRPKTLQN